MTPTELHHALDLLMAHFISKTGLLPSKTTIMELSQWSYQQTLLPTAGDASLKPDETGNSPMVTQDGLLSMQVCVPADWSEGQVLAFAERKNPCGTENGWGVRKTAALLGDDPERNPCADSTRPGYVHIMLDA